MDFPHKKFVRWSALGLVFFLGACFVLLPGEYPTEQSAIRVFVIEEEFTKVRKIMVRTDAAKQIVTMGGDSEFVEQKWQGGSADLGGEDFGEALLRGVLSSDPDWQLELHGILKVRTLDDYVGQNVVALEQNVEIAPDYIQSDANLIEGSERLLGYTMTTRLEREDIYTRVELKLTQEIKTGAPWFAHGIADRSVLASAEKNLANQEVAMRKLIAEHRDKNWFFPLR